MNKVKKLVAAFAAVACLGLVAACGGEEEGGKNKDPKKNEKNMDKGK